jgi:hypothetical protein
VKAFDEFQSLGIISLDKLKFHEIFARCFQLRLWDLLDSLLAFLWFDGFLLGIMFVFCESWGIGGWLETVYLKIDIVKAFPPFLIGQLPAVE